SSGTRPHACRRCPMPWMRTTGSPAPSRCVYSMVLVMPRHYCPVTCTASEAIAGTTRPHPRSADPASGAERRLRLVELALRDTRGNPRPSLRRGTARGGTRRPRTGVGAEEGSVLGRIGFLVGLRLVHGAVHVLRRGVEGVDLQGHVADVGDVVPLACRDHDDVVVADLTVEGQVVLRGPHLGTPAPLLDAQELVVVLVDLEPDVVAGGDGHDGQLPVRAGPQGGAVVRVLQRRGLDVDDVGRGPVVAQVDLFAHGVSPSQALAPTTSGTSIWSPSDSSPSATFVAATEDSSSGALVRIRWSKALSEAVEPAPSAVTICLYGSMVQSPAAKTPGRLVAPIPSMTTSPRSESSTASPSHSVLGSRPIWTKTPSTSSCSDSPPSRGSIVIPVTLLPSPVTSVVLLPRRMSTFGSERSLRCRTSSARISSMNSTSVTWPTMPARSIAASTPELPPPMTAIGLPLKRGPSQCGQKVTPLLRYSSSPGTPMVRQRAPVARMT